MSSTPVVGTLIAVLSPVSFNSSFASPSYTPSPSSGVNIAFSNTFATSPTPPTSPTSVYSEQSQQSSSAIQSTMLATTITTTATPSPASPPTPSPTVSLTSASLSPTLSSIVVTSSNDLSTTSTSETSVQPTTSSTTSPRTTHSPTLMSFPFTATTLGTTTYLTLTSTSNVPSQGSPERTDTPLTTVLENTTVFITSTNSQGQVVTSIPPVITEVITTTGSGGIITTVTQAIVNPTLAPNNSAAGNSSFFTNTGAVVGVFVVVGLASASIVMWILFAIPQRQRIKRIEQDTAVEAVVAAAGLNRAPLDDDDDSPILPNTHHHFSSEISQRSGLLGLGASGSLSTSIRLSEVPDDTIKDGANSHSGRLVEHRTNSRPRGYILARTTSPSPRIEPCTDDLGSSRDRKSSYGHTPTYSVGSFEPLLANYVQNMSDPDTPAPTTQLSRNHSLRCPENRSALDGYSRDGTPNNRSRASSKRQNSYDSSVLQDEEDYTRYVLMVRNVPDDQSQHSS